MAFNKRVRIIKKIREAAGEWRFISLDRLKGRYVWDKRPGVFFIEWWEGPHRKRSVAGHTPSEALEAQRRKTNELIGALITEKQMTPNDDESASAEPPTAIADATKMFLDHVAVHSPDKPRTHQRYKQVLEHFARILAKRKYIEAVTRADIDDYKAARSREKSAQHKDRPIAPRTINYEVQVLRTFYYFLMNERGNTTENPCARFKPLKDPKAKAHRRPPTYTQEDLNKLFAKCTDDERTIFATFLLTGLREEELYFLTWPDVDLKHPEEATIRVTGDGKKGFSPKDYEERIIPIPEDLANLLAELPKKSPWVFPGKTGGRTNHLLRRLKEIAAAAEVQDATLHKFRHTYATRLLESGTDIVTVQKLMGHSDIDTTRQYLNPDDALKRAAANRLSVPKAPNKKDA